MQKGKRKPQTYEEQMHYINTGELPDAEPTGMTQEQTDKLLKNQENAIQESEKTRKQQMYVEGTKIGAQAATASLGAISGGEGDMSVDPSAIEGYSGGSPSPPSSSAVTTNSDINAANINPYVGPNRSSRSLEQITSSKATHGLPPESDLARAPQRKPSWKEYAAGYGSGGMGGAAQTWSGGKSLTGNQMGDMGITTALDFYYPGLGSIGVPVASAALGSMDDEKDDVAKLQEQKLQNELDVARMATKGGSNVSPAVTNVIAQENSKAFYSRARALAKAKMAKGDLSQEEVSNIMGKGSSNVAQAAATESAVSQQQAGVDRRRQLVANAFLIGVAGALIGPSLGAAKMATGGGGGRRRRRRRRRLMA